MKEQIIREFNKLGIADLGEITQLYEEKGSFVNSEFRLPSGQIIRIWDDEKIYYINQIERADNDKCYGLVADQRYLLVCEYGCGGSDAEIVIFKRWN